MRMSYRLYFLLILFLTRAIYAFSLSPTYEISPSDVKEILNQMFEAHVSHKKLTPVLIERSLCQFIDEIDPMKTYFLAEDIQPWIHPSEESLKVILSAVENDDFSPFAAILAKMQEAIQRRSRLECELESSEPTSPICLKDMKDLAWAKNEEELKQRLIRIKSFQNMMAEKVEKQAKEKILQRIAKRKVAREEEILGKNDQERQYSLLTTFLKSIASSLDTHTAYFTPKEASQFLIQIQQRLFGIGVQLRDDFDGYTVVKIIEGSPASKANALKANDKIIAINDEPIAGIEISQGVDLIRGEEGTSVTLKVLRSATDEYKDELLDVEIIRGEVILKEFRIESDLYPYGDGVIAHIALHSFYYDPFHSSASDLSEEINKIKKDHKIRGIILDLRKNTGGVLPQAVAVTGLFITKGIVVSIKDNHGNVEHLRHVDGKTAWDGPLIVLTSKASASAAEIVAQTLQDYGRAIIVGDEHTYGKGTFQTFTLDSQSNGKVNPKGEFKVTRGLYYTVSGKSPQLVGVHPDIVVPGLESILDIGEQHTKFPLGNDSIPENFFDDLADIPFIQREQMNWLYRFNLQPRLKTYNRFIPVLQKNSEGRLFKDKLYQSFLTGIHQEEMVSSSCELLIDADLQLKESVEVMKDLILLLN